MNALFTRRAFCVLAMLCAGTIHAWAQSPTVNTDQIFSWATPAVPGCACAVSQHGKLIVNRAYGSADLERQVPIDTNTTFDAGSLRKQFLSAAALLLIEEGRLSLTEDIHRYIKELPNYGHKITIEHLMTHTSGVRDWIGMLGLTSDKPDAFTLALRHRGLNFTPGEEWSYSNSGYVLLKEIIVRVSGQSFPEFSRKRLFEPLGMKATSYRDDLHEAIPNRAQAYDKRNGEWKTAILLDNERGGGGALFTTAADLVIWNDALTNNRLSRFVSEKLVAPAQLSNGRKLTYGRGIFLDTYRGATELWHTGSAEGYKSWLGRYPEYGLSIAIMCNSGDGTDRRSFAHRIFDQLVTDNSKLTDNFNPLPPAYTIEGLDVNSKTGLFFHESNGEPLRLVAFQGRLRVDGGPGFTALTKDRFKRWGANIAFMSQDEFELQFTSNDRLELKTMEGKTMHYRRAIPYSPTPEELKVLEGRYESDELRSALLLSPTTNGLEMSLAHAPGTKLLLKPIDPDVFQVSQMYVRFLRNKAGKVTGFDYSNPSVSHIRFTRK